MALVSLSINADSERRLGGMVESRRLLLLLKEFSVFMADAAAEVYFLLVVVAAAAAAADVDCDVAPALIRRALSVASDANVDSLHL